MTRNVQWLEHPDDVDRWWREHHEREDAIRAAESSADRIMEMSEPAVCVELVRPAEQDGEDPLAFYRGVLVALPLGLVCWAVFLAGVWLVTA